METFPTQIGKALLMMITISAVILFASDFGKLYVSEFKAQSLARNSAEYVVTFGVEESALSGYEYGSVSLDVAKDLLEDYWDMYFEEMGYVKIPHSDSMPSQGHMKAVYAPRDDPDYFGKGPVFARAIFDDPGDAGRVRVNIEEKVPAGVRNIMEGMEVDYRVYENGAYVEEDFEGFSGYYSVTGMHGSRLDIVD